MMEHDANRIEPVPNPLTPAIWTVPMLRMWQLPLMLGTTWWNATVQMLWPQEREHVRCHGDAHAQLVVTESIESTGEQGLLA